MRNLKENKVLVIDPVGCKAGMDYYDNNLIMGFQDNGVTAAIASNYTNELYNAQSFFRSNRINGTFSKLFDWLVGFWKAFLYARRHRFQQIILHSFSAELKDIYPYILGKIFSIKITTIVHDVSGFAQGDTSFVRSLIYKCSYRLVVHNNYSKQVLLNYLSADLQHKLWVIPHGHFLNLPDPSISKTEARKILGIAQNECMLLFFGQIKKQKGLNLLIQALAHSNEQIILTIAGKPWKDTFDHYQALINELALKRRVRLKIHYIEDKQRELLFKSADLIVIPYYEIYQSGVLLMAMSYAIPVLASDLPPNKEIINHLDNGLLFKSGDIHSLAKNINHYFDHKKKLNYLTENSLNLLKDRYNWTSIARAYVKMLFSDDSFI